MYRLVVGPGRTEIRGVTGSVQACCLEIPAVACWKIRDESVGE
jgi:hypothetical protein